MKYSQIPDLLLSSCGLLSLMVKLNIPGIKFIVNLYMANQAYDSFWMKVTKNITVNIIWIYMQILSNKSAKYSHSSLFSTAFSMCNTFSTTFAMSHFPLFVFSTFAYFIAFLPAETHFWPIGSGFAVSDSKYGRSSFFAVPVPAVESCVSGVLAFSEPSICGRFFWDVADFLFSKENGRRRKTYMTLHASKDLILVPILTWLPTWWMLMTVKGRNYKHCLKHGSYFFLNFLPIFVLNLFGNFQLRIRRFNFTFGDKKFVSAENSDVKD